LYDNLTTAQHIEIISRLRGIPKDRIPDYIRALSAKVGIQSELDKKSNTLSGGNKRKLSLALAIAGDPKVIFLDEPTSGLDPNARRNFWDIVRSLRDEGKTILLTTHNLDEADELADRIAILSKGKLLILGTSNFLKKKYGVGYNLIITPRPDTVQDFYPNKDRYIDFVRRIIATSELDLKTSSEMIRITLPYEESKNFAELFAGLEKEPLIEVALELNTLEDVFVSIGHQEEVQMKELLKKIFLKISLYLLQSTKSILTVLGSK
jgi:ATP-binding cassette subfamily A (ABC1) protein 3